MATDPADPARRVSVAQARDRLPAILDDVAQHGPIEITRHGEPVAVILSLDEYRRLSDGRPDFWTAYERFREGVPLSDLGLDDAVFSGLRDRSPGRDVPV